MFFKLAFCALLIASLAHARPQSGASDAEADQHEDNIRAKLLADFNVLKNLPESVRQQINAVFLGSSVKSMANIKAEVGDILKNSGVSGADEAFNEMLDAFKNMQIKKIQLFINNQSNQSVKDAAQIYMEKMEDDSLNAEQKCEAKFKFEESLSVKERMQFNFLLYGRLIEKMRSLYKKCGATPFPMMAGFGQDSLTQVPPTASAVCSHIQEMFQHFREFFKQLKECSENNHANIAGGQQ